MEMTGSRDCALLVNANVPMFHQPQPCPGKAQITI